MQGELGWLIKSTNQDAALSEGQLGLILEEVGLRRHQHCCLGKSCTLFVC